jgi:hypothetical protein
MKKNVRFELIDGIVFLIIILIFVGCQKSPEEPSYTSDKGVLEGPSYVFAKIIFKDLNTNQTIAGASIEWSKETSGPGSIAEITSATSNAEGYVQLEKTVSNGVSSYNRTIVRTYASGYHGWVGTKVITLGGPGTVYTWILTPQ